MAASNLNIPNSLSGLRILLVPVLLAIAYTGNGNLFLSVLVVSLLTDGLDGYLARRLNQTTELGARLDSWGDLFTYGAMVLGLLWIWPAIFYRELLFLLFGIAFYLLPLLASLVKFHQMPRYHTWAAKVAAILMAPAYFLLTLSDLSWPFRLVVIFHMYVAIEELLITFTLNRTYYDVPTLMHAREMARRAKQRAKDKIQEQREKLQAQRGRMQVRREQRKEERASRRRAGKRPGNK